MPYAISGTVVVGIWAKKAGVWAKVTNRTINIYQGGYSSGGSKTVNWSMVVDQDLGTGVQAVGVTVESFTGGTAADVLDMTQLQWQSQTSSGTRTATPGGELSTATVRPQ